MQKAHRPHLRLVNNAPKTMDEESLEKLDNLAVGDLLIIKTQNSIYEIQIVDSKGEYLVGKVTGGKNDYYKAAGVIFIVQREDGFHLALESVKQKRSLFETSPIERLDTSQKPFLRILSKARAAIVNLSNKFA